MKRVQIDASQSSPISILLQRDASDLSTSQNHISPLARNKARTCTKLLPDPANLTLKAHLTPASKLPYHATPTQEAASQFSRSTELGHASGVEEGFGIEFPMPGFITKPLLSSPERLDSPSNRHKDHSQQKDQRGSSILGLDGPALSPPAVKPQHQLQQQSQDEQQQQPLQSPDVKTDQSGTKHSELQSLKSCQIWGNDMLCLALF